MKLQKPVGHYMRAMHRDIGCFIIGITIIYCISGIMLIYRETGFLKREKTIEKNLQPDIKIQELGRILHIRDFKILKAEGDIIFFNNGTYNRSTGTAHYTAELLPAVLERFNGLHKASTRNGVHWFSLAYGILLLFLALSSFWMYSPGSRLFRRSLLISSTGIIAGMIVLL